jgi:DNA polymerase-1
MMATANSIGAYRLLHDGILALQKAEHQGIRMDMNYYEKAKDELIIKIEDFEHTFKETNFYKKWVFYSDGKGVNIHSPIQLSNYLFKNLKLKTDRFTASGKESSDEETLSQLNIPELNDLLYIRKLKKIKDTYIEGFIREAVKGVIHPFFNVHLVKTFRSCIAKGSLILVTKDFIKFPNGIPIETIKKDDYVYCFDDDLNPSIQKVLWAGKTGNKKVIRIHYSSKATHKKGFLDVTPEHLIRLSNGEYVQAKNLIGDFRTSKDSKHTPKISVLSCKRKNGFTGHLKNGNHSITKIEWLDKKVDVYDIEVEKYHNFIANELCVHNSSDSPNFQNIPKRDKEAKSIIRQGLYAREGNHLMAIDFSGVEIRVAACYHKDPTMINYINNSESDMHGDMAKQIFKINKFDRNIPEHRVLRNAAKNGFVFPEFYGDYYKNCANNLANNWGKLPKGKWKSGQGISMPNGTLSDHLIEKGINSFNEFTQHLEVIEKDFWSKRFPVYRDWKETWYKKYQRYGYVDSFTGFRFFGIMKKNDVINYPIQSAAFHCLLWSFIQITKQIEKYNLNSRLIGQIHDEAVLDVPPNEVNTIKDMSLQIMEKALPKEWDWIIVPITVEVELSKAGGSWNTMEKLE